MDEFLRTKGIKDYHSVTVRDFRRRADGKTTVDIGVKFYFDTPVTNDVAKSIRDKIRSSVNDGELDSIYVDKTFPVTTGCMYFTDYCKLRE